MTRELFYLRMMLTACKGAISFEDIRTVTNIQYPTYREACFSMGFLQDDREFVEVIKEAKDWGTTNYLRDDEVKASEESDEVPALKAELERARVVEEKFKSIAIKV